MILLNIAMFLVDVAAVVWMVRRPVPKRWRSGIGAAVLVGVVGMFFAPSGVFGKMQLLAWGMFVHVPLLLLVAGAGAWGKHRRAGMVMGAVAVVLIGVGVEAVFVEPHWLEVTHVEIRSDKVARPVKIALLADIQTDSVGDYERAVLERVVREKPDLVLFVGDYVQEYDVPRHLQLLAELRKLISEVHLAAPGGMYAVQGNIDWSCWKDAFTDTGVRPMSRTQRVEACGLRLTGLSRGDSQNAGLKLAAEGEEFHVVFGHHPDFALGEVQADLLLAGHTHGGQVRLPWVGPLVKASRVPRAWAAGVTRLEGGRTLIVSRGIGMERGQAPRLRFLCRPELVFITISPREK